MPRDRNRSLPWDDMMDTFDPNRPDMNEWATFIPRWRGAFHTHPTRAGALRALNPTWVRGGILYQRDGTGWKEIARSDERDKKPEACEICGDKPLSSHWDDTLHRRWVKVRRKIVDPPRMAWMCNLCRLKNRRQGI